MALPVKKISSEIGSPPFLRNSQTVQHSTYLNFTHIRSMCAAKAPVWRLFFLLLFPSASFAIEQFKSEREAQSHCSADWVVWLNTRSGSVHRKGQPWYGRTHAGTYVCQSELSKKRVNPVQPVQSNTVAWAKFVSDERRTVYVSPHPVESHAGHVTILSMVDLKDAAKLSDGKEFMSWRTQYEFDCVNRQSRVIAASMYSANMGEGEVTGGVLYEKPDWESISVSSNGEMLWSHACGKMASK